MINSMNEEEKKRMDIFMKGINQAVNEIMGQHNKGRGKGTSTYYIKGTIRNKKVCYTLAKTGYNGRFGFWSWIQTKYKNGMIKRTKFAKSGSKKKAEQRAERLFNELSEKNGFNKSSIINENDLTNNKPLPKITKICEHSFIDKDNNGVYGLEVCRYCGVENGK